jgi:hypothetical protein
LKEARVGAAAIIAEEGPDVVATEARRAGRTLRRSGGRALAVFVALVHCAVEQNRVGGGGGAGDVPSAPFGDRLISMVSGDVIQTGNKPGWEGAEAGGLPLY